MGDLAKDLMHELECQTVFTIPIFGGIEILESVVVSWIITAVIIGLCIFLTRDMKTQNISRRQAVAELIVTKLKAFIGDMVGPHGSAYVPYLSTLIVFLGISNIIGIFGFKPPTKDLNVPLALAIMSIVLIEAAGIYHLGVKIWLKRFSEPVAVVTPIKILELVTKPLSLCMRLFGNILGAFVIMELIKLVVPVVFPAVFCLYFDLFDGLLQAYVFVFLTALYISEAIEVEQD